MKIDKIKTIVELLKGNNNCMEKSQIIESIGISESSLNRYIKQLKKSGFKIISRKREIKILEISKIIEEPQFTKRSYRSLKILLFVFNNNPCSRLKLRQAFCSEPDDLDKLDDYEEKISDKYLDMYLNDIINSRFIEKFTEDNQVFYRVSDGLLKSDSIPFDKAIEVLTYLNIHRNALPFGGIIERIVDKLGNALVHQARKSMDAFEDLKIAYEVFPNCLEVEEEDHEDKRATELEYYCSRNTILKLEMDSGSILILYPFCVVYNYNIGKWYLVYRHITDDEGYDILRLENIKNFEVAGENTEMDAEALRFERKKAKQEVEESFCIALEAAKRVIILFKNDTGAIETAKKRLSQCEGEFTELNNGNLLFSGNISGTNDFMSWLRRFGNNAIILHPEPLRERHFNSAKITLNEYAKVYGGI